MTEESTDRKTEQEEKVEIEIKAESIAPTNGDGDPPGDEAYERRDYDSRQGSHDGYTRDRDSRRYDGRRSDRMSDDEKLKRYKKQSEERLLDIKRSREAKIGKKRR